MLRWPAAIVEMDYVVVVVGWRGCDPLSDASVEIGLPLTP